MEFVALSIMITSALVILAVGVNYCEKYHQYIESYNPSIANIDFKSFHSWYMLNPNRYILYKNCVKVKKDSSDYDYEYLGFKTFRDWCKYNRFVNDKKAKSDNALSTESMVKILNLVQSDIDAARVKISEERNKAINEIRHIV